jgi:hypothetical protein
MTTIDEVKKEIDVLKEKLMEMDKRLAILHAWVEQDGARVCQHMDLVEKVTQPVHYVMDRFNYLLYHHNPFME